MDGVPKPKRLSLGLRLGLRLGQSPTPTLTLTMQLAWAPLLDTTPLASAAPVDSRLVVTGGGGFALPPSLDGLQHLSVLPTSQAGVAELSGTLPAALRSLTMGLSADRTNIDWAWSHSEIDISRPAPLSLSGTLPATLEHLVWLLDEVPALPLP